MKQINKWELLASEDVSPSHYFPLEKHTVKLANGHIVDDYYLDKLPDVVLIVAITKAGEIVLVRQYKHGVDEITIEIPGGIVQKDCSPEQSAVNELHEETGIQVTTSALIPLGRVSGEPTKSSSIRYGFLVKDVEFNSTQQLDDNEDIEVVTITPEEVMKMIMDGRIWCSDTIALLLKADVLKL